MTIRIIVAGPRGKMGSELLKMIMDDPDLSLSACIDRKHDGKSIKDVMPALDLDAPIYENPNDCFQSVAADVFVDLTVPDVAFDHAKTALENGLRTIVGTSGLGRDKIAALAKLSKEKKIGSIIAPNFAIGAVLMMKFSQLAAKYMPDVEIIEKHHDQKLDAPSGTAIKTAELIQQNRNHPLQGHRDEKEILPGARGANLDGIPIHSVRLPGLIAHQEVIFGSGGQLLTIKHDSFHRKSFMPGIKLAIEKVMDLEELVYGLENIL